MFFYDIINKYIYIYYAKVLIMKRTELKKIFQTPEQLGGKTVTVCGWAKTIRDSKSFGFIELNDGSYFKNCQIVFDRS